MPTFLGVDLGTQSLKTLIFDPDTNRVVHTATAPLELISHPDGTREQLASSWVDALHDCLAQVPSETRATIAALGVSGQQHGFVPVAADGEVLTPVKLWCDTTTVNECDEITAAAGPDFVLRTVGPFTTGFTAPKIRWLKKHHPEKYARLATVMLPHDYLNFYLTGNRVAECGDASGTAALDVGKRIWSRPMMKAIDPDRDLTLCFPTLIDAGSAAGKVRPGVAEQLGLPSGVLVSAGGGDNMMAAIGTGNVVEGRLTASLGTSGTLFGYSGKPVLDPDGSLAAFCSSTGGWLPLLCTMNCTVSTEQLRSLFSLDLKEIDKLVADVPAGCSGVITLPFYNGERTPNLPNGKAVIFGLDPRNTTQGHMVRSAMEAAVFGLKAGLLALRKLDMHFEEVTLTGGGSTSAVWGQICADVFNMRVRVLKEKENAALGGALQALWCHGIEGGNKRPIEEIVDRHLTEDVEKGCLPDADRVKVYEDVYSRYTELLSALTPLFTKSQV